jgi:hypothetical protein
MNREIYNQIKEYIKAEFDEKMAALGVLSGNGAIFNSKTPLKPLKTALEPSRTPEMKVLKEIPENGHQGAKYVRLSVPCEFKGCIRNVHPESRACPACSKKICSKHLRGKVCMECNSVGEE